jgi:hypothetical protein
MPNTPRARLVERPFSDMLGFKLEVPRREGTSKDKARPIYLDMQVRHISVNLCLFNSVLLRQRRL